MALANVDAMKWPLAMDAIMTSAGKVHGNAPSGLPLITRGDAMRIVHWARKGQKGNDPVDLYKTQLYLLGYEKTGDKFRMEPEWVAGLVPSPKQFWDRAIVKLRFLDGKAPKFKGSGHLQRIWSEEAAAAWLRLQAERGLKKRPRPIKKAKQLSAILVLLALAFVFATRK